MKYYKEIKLKNGNTLVLRNGTEKDGKECLETFIETHSESDFLLSYPYEIKFTVEQESNYLLSKAESENEVEILAIYDNKIVGTAGIDSMGNSFKVKHRSDFGISVLEKYQGLGIGKELTKAAVECAKEMGYLQVELQAVSENYKAINLYKEIGFIEFGRNPLGFKTVDNTYQELVLMRLTF